MQNMKTMVKIDEERIDNITFITFIIITILIEKNNNKMNKKNNDYHDNYYDNY